MPGSTPGSAAARLMTSSKSLACGTMRASSCLSLPALVRLPHCGGSIRACAERSPEPLHGRLAHRRRIVVVAGVPDVAYAVGMAQARIHLPNRGVVFFFHRAALANGLAHKKRPRRDE